MWFCQGESLKIQGVTVLCHHSTEPLMFEMKGRFGVLQKGPEMALSEAVRVNSASHLGSQDDGDTGTMEERYRNRVNPVQEKCVCCRQYGWRGEVMEPLWRPDNFLWALDAGCRASGLVFIPLGLGFALIWVCLTVSLSLPFGTEMIILYQCIVLYILYSV